MEFKAETKKLLEIVAKSIYTEKEIFLRELLSNCSGSFINKTSLDALEKERLKKLQKQQSPDELSVSITTNEADSTLTIFDSGIGMTKEELIKNLGTIAYSGSEHYQKALRAHDQHSAAGATEVPLIGQFGVGFYSSFIVSEYVEVISKSEDASMATRWISSGGEDFEIEDVKPEDIDFKRGTKIVLKLKPDSRHFSKEREVEGIIKKYSIYLNHPIRLNNELLNSLQAIWYKSKSELSEEEYTRHFEATTGRKGSYLYKLHYSSDVPLTVRAILYIPKSHQEKIGLSSEEWQLSLYSRKILIKKDTSDLLPNCFKFVKGVIDCEDIPLNISRETYQNSPIIEKLKALTRKRIIKLLSDEMNADREKYLTFYEEFKPFLKEGLIKDIKGSSDLLELLMFQNSFSATACSLDEYIAKMKPEQKNIYYFFASNRTEGLQSPHMDLFQDSGVPVLFTDHHFDEMFLRASEKYKDHIFCNVVGEKELLLEEFSTLCPKQLEEVKSPKKAGLEPEEVTPFCMWLKHALGNKIAKVEVGKWLRESPACIDSAFSSSFMQMMGMIQQQVKFAPKSEYSLKINTKHAIFGKLNALRKHDNSLAEKLANAFLDTCFMREHYPFDPQEVGRQGLELNEEFLKMKMGIVRIKEEKKEAVQRKKKGGHGVKGEIKLDSKGNIVIPEQKEE